MSGLPGSLWLRHLSGASKLSIRIAVVGLGFGGAFVPIYRDHPDIEEVGICDSNPNRLKAVGDAEEIANRYDKFEDVLADSRWDAVHLLTPVPLHVEQTLAVLNSGRHCACAVPAATDLAGLRQVIEAQDRTGKNYMMMETAVYDRNFLYANDLLRQERFGTLTFLRGLYTQDLEGGYPKYWRGVPPMHYSTHVMGPILALAGTQASRVTCLGAGQLREDLQQPGANTFPLQSALFSLKDSLAIAEVTRSWFQMARPYTEAFSVYGDRGGFEWQQLEDEPPLVYTLEPLVEGAWGRHVPAQRVEPPLRRDLLPDELSQYASGGHGGAHPHLANEFVRSIVEGRPAAIDARVAARWTAPGICAHQSSLQGGAMVDIPAF
jgi:predicted dehydrogenase